MQRNQVAIVCRLRSMIPRSRQHMDVIPVNHHTGVVTRLLWSLATSNDTCKTPIDAIFGKMQGISLISFLEQYILYPQTIRIERIQNMDIYGLLPYFTFNGLVNHFKFIYICFIPITYINLKKLLLNRRYLKEKDFFYFST